MQTDHAAVLNTLVRVQRFLDANGDALGSINQSGSRQVLDDVVTTLGSHAVSQTSSKRIGAAQVAKERVLRNALKLNQMRPIATVAAAQLRQVPEFTALKMPPANSTSRALIAWAGAMSEAATAYDKTFITAGLAADFITRLHDAANALSDAIANRGATKSTQSGATAGLSAETARGRQAMKVLDSIVEPQIAGNIALLAQWKAAKRIGGKTMPVAGTTIDAAAKGPAAPVASGSINTTFTAPNASAPSAASNDIAISTPGSTITGSPQTSPAPLAPAL
ncbi:MAG: hypothetical protein ACREPM_10935 [Gemmatimonadaceae bacterium]